MIVSNPRVKIVTSLVVLLLSFATWAEPSAIVDVVISPGGSFKIKTSEVKGQALQMSDEVSASNIIVNLKSLKTGIETRDKHTMKYLNTDKFPEAVLVSATGKSGKGEGVIKIRGIEKKISGTYKIVDKQLEAEFSLKLSEFDITGIRYMGMGVKDDVTLHIVVPITAASTATPNKAPAKK